MKKRITALLLMMAMSISLTGCGYIANVDIHGNNATTSLNSYWSKMDVAIMEEALKQDGAEMTGSTVKQEDFNIEYFEKNFKKVNINGIEYYEVPESEPETSEFDEDDLGFKHYDNDYCIIGKETFEQVQDGVNGEIEDIDSDMDLSKMSMPFMIVNVNFNKPIVKTNLPEEMLVKGSNTSISIDAFKKYNVKEDLYIVFNESKYNNKPVFKSITNNKCYKTAKDIVITDSILKNVEIKRNGKVIKGVSYKQTENGNKNKYKQHIMNYFDKLYITEEGKYSIKATTLAGKETEINFIIDKTKPTIKGVANGKTYNKTVKIKYSDKLSKIKEVKLNGKKIKNGKKVSKNGKYTVIATDKAGNKTKIKFTIKK